MGRHPPSSPQMSSVPTPALGLLQPSISSGLLEDLAPLTTLTQGRCLHHWPFHPSKPHSSFHLPSSEHHCVPWHPSVWAVEGWPPCSLLELCSLAQEFPEDWEVGTGCLQQPLLAHSAFFQIISEHRSPSCPVLGSHKPAEQLSSETETCILAVLPQLCAREKLLLWSPLCLLTE